MKAETYNHEHAGASKCKGDGNRGDKIIAPFQVGVLGQVLEVTLLLEEPLARQKWCFCHPALKKARQLNNTMTAFVAIIPRSLVYMT